MTYYDYDDAEVEAFTIVMEAVEEASDVEDLQPWAKAKLAEMHNEAAQQIGEEIARPDDAVTPERHHGRHAVTVDEIRAARRIIDAARDLPTLSRVRAALAPLLDALASLPGVEAV
jgi:hypothetical protein